jgi:hypothetical protein
MNSLTHEPAYKIVARRASVQTARRSFFARLGLWALSLFDGGTLPERILKKFVMAVQRSLATV